MTGRTATALALLALMAGAGAAGEGSGTEAEDGKFNCARPFTPETCRGVGVGCEPVLDAQRCAARGGRFTRLGGVCGLCDLCAQYVGEGQPCYLDIDPERPSQLCEAPLLCSSGYNGTCVLEERCKPARSR